MMWFRSQDDARLDAVRAALAGTPPLDPPADLLARILASRASGKRVRLPNGGSKWRVRIVAIAATVAAIVALADSIDRGRGGGEPGARDLYTDLLGGALWSPSVGTAQEAHKAPSPPRYPLIANFDASRVVGGRWTYEGRTTTDGLHTGATSRVAITASARRLDDLPVWLVTTQRTRAPDAADSLFVSQATLRPVRFAINGRNSRTYVEQLYSGDSVHETIDVTGRRERHFRGVAALPGPREAALIPFVPFDVNLTLLSQALALNRRWRGSVYALGLVSPPSRMPPFTPVDLRVIGRDRVTVPAGTFDCWKLEVIRRSYAGGESRSHMWMSRDHQWVVKTEYRGSDFVTEQLLTSYESPTPPAP